jgi:hypothetical protein
MFLHPTQGFARNRLKGTPEPVGKSFGIAQRLPISPPASTLQVFQFIQSLILRDFAAPAGTKLKDCGFKDKTRFKTILL